MVYLGIVGAAGGVLPWSHSTLAEMASVILNGAS